MTTGEYVSFMHLLNYPQEIAKLLTVMEGLSVVAIAWFFGFTLNYVIRASQL
jgi:hypothetical protein